MGRHGHKNGFRAGGTRDEEPVAAILIVYGEGVTSELEVDPRLCDAVCEEAGDRGALKCADVVPECLPRATLGQVQEVPGAVVHSDVEKTHGFSVDGA